MCNWISILLSLAIATDNICSHHVASFSLPHHHYHLSSSTHQPSIILSSSRNYKWHTKYSKQQHSSTTHILYSTSNNDELIKALLNNKDTPSDNDPYSKYTHQIAIPLSNASELHSALTAIQTSLVRDCPRLIRACIMPALLRMPLLYVDASSLITSGSTMNDGSVDVLLEEVVHNSIRNVVYGQQTTDEEDGIVKPILLPFQGLELQGNDNSVLYAVGHNVNDLRKKKRSVTKNRFISADTGEETQEEDDGVIIVDDWESSAAINTGPSGWEILEKLVHNIQNELESKHGLDTCWPLDEAQVEVEYDDDGDNDGYEDPLVAAIKQKQKKKRWRPRVPFVRLPTDFYQELEADSEKKKKNKGDNNDADNDNKDDSEPSFIDMGFDGISPLFWYEAWGEEDILSPPGVRMQSVAVYKRMSPGGGEAESSFYVPTSSSGGPQTWKSGSGADKGGLSMELPAGDAKLRARERREAAKANERLGEVEQRAEQEWEEGKARWMEELDNQGLDGSGLLSDDDEDSLAQFDVGMEIGEVTVEGDAAYSSPWVERDVDESDVTASEMVEQVVEPPIQPSASSSHKEKSQSNSPKMSQQSSDTKPLRELPSIEDNPIFQRLWKGKPQVTAKGQNAALALDGTPPESNEPLPPYPSDGHFVGAWRIVSFTPGSNPAAEDTESKESDNFILRVDKQVMGGPVLDAEYKHKAAGGEWRMFQAVRKSASDSEDSESISPPITQTRLRIKLLIPPEKKLNLVLEGEVTRMPGGGGGGGGGGTDSSFQLANGGILDGMLDNIDDIQPQSGSTDGESLLYCSGEAWMEDVEGGTNRRKVGTFSLMKLKTIKRENLIYTVDVNRIVEDTLDDLSWSKSEDSSE